MTTLTEIEDRALHQTARYNGDEAAGARPPAALLNDQFDWGSPGLTKREAMAMHLMQALMTSTSNGLMVRGASDREHLAELAVQSADALLLELARPRV